jgi:iron complex outermembrane receptor protein
MRTRLAHGGWLAYALGALIFLSLGASPRILAEETQSAGPADSGALQEIVVTAQRRSESLRDVPISVTAVTPEQLAEFDIKTTDQLVLITPGLAFDKGYSYAENYIRGIGSAFTNPGLESAVATYVDGAYLERSFGGVFDLLDPGTIQVLKGPQGTLYGRNATGGAILISTADPTPEQDVRVAAEGGSEGHVLGEIVANLPVTDTLAVRFAARENHDGSYISNLYDGTGMGQRTSGEARLKVRWAPTDDFSAVLGVDHSDTSENAGFTQQRASAPDCGACAIPGSGATPVAGFYNTDNDVNYPFVTRITSVNLRLNYTAGIFQVNSISAMRNDLIDAKIDVDYTSFPLYIYKELQHGRSWSEDLQAFSNSSGWINGMVAASYFHDSAYISADLTGDAFAPLVEALGSYPYTQNTVDTKSETVLGELYLTPIDRLKLTLGTRYTHDSRSLGVDANLSGVLASGGAPTDPTSLGQNASFDSTTPRVVVAYDLGLTNVYASFNKGFKAGGFNTPAFGEQAIIKPETIDSYELGAKFVSADRTLRADVAAFHYIYSDVQVSVVDLTHGGALIQNAASALGNGGESDLAYRATHWLELIGGLAYLDTKFTSYPNASVVVPTYVDGTPTGLATGTENLAGAPLTRSPRWSGYVGANLSGEIGNNWTGHFNTIVHHTSPYDFDAGRGGPLGYDYQPGYTLANLTASAGPTDGRYSVGVYVNNLSNTKYYIQRATSATFGVFDQVARPLTFGVRAEYKF